MRLVIHAAFIITIFIICGCNNNSGQKAEKKSGGKTEYAVIEKAKWLKGSWQNKTGEGNLIEKWEEINDSTFKGISYLLRRKDTIFIERISIEQRGNELYYIPTVPDQNSGQPVVFRLSESKDGRLVFENDRHDFPQRIIYSRVSADSLLAEINGTTAGKFDSRLFPMKRISYN